MDRFFNSKRQSMTSYLDIFKACRLCGSGGGYKMPIIQKINNDDIIDVEAELKQKIKECVSIEVHQDDRMPPLICELCVDKVNDFYEFREMCRATNARVRASLGLPPQTLLQDPTEDCILGVTGPVFHNSKEPERPATPKAAGVSKKDSNQKPKKPMLNIAKKMSEKRQTRRAALAAPPPTLLAERSSRRRQAESPLPVPNTKKLRFSSPSPKPASPALVEKKRTSSDKRKSVESPTEVRKTEGRRSRDSTAADSKRIKESPDLGRKGGKEPTLKIKELPPRNKEIPLRTREMVKAKEVPQKTKEAPQKTKEVVKAKEPPPKKKEVVYPFKCEICNAGFMKQISIRQHQLSTHTAQITPDKLGCVPCREWFSSAKETETHHRWHRTSGSYYHCARCSTDFKVLLGFTKHFQLKQCIPEPVVPDVPCPVCTKTFATETWMNQHKCPGPPFLGDKCGKCPKTFTSRIQLKRHEKVCKGVLIELNPNNPHLGELRDLSIPVDRCDDMVRRIKEEPGLITDIKTEPLEHSFEECSSDVLIKQEIKQEYNDYTSDYDNGFGDNYSSAGSENEGPMRPNLVLNPFARKSITQVDSLSVISLRSIFSTKMFKKKSKSKRKRHMMKMEGTGDGFDALISKTEPMDSVENHFDHLESDVPMAEAAGDDRVAAGDDRATAETGTVNNTVENGDEVRQNGSEDAVEKTAEEEAINTEKSTQDQAETDNSNNEKIVGDRADAHEAIGSDSQCQNTEDEGISKEKDAVDDDKTEGGIFENDKSEEESNNFGNDIQMAVDVAEKFLKEDDETDSSKPEVENETDKNEKAADSIAEASGDVSDSVEDGKIPEEAVKATVEKDSAEAVAPDGDDTIAASENVPQSDAELADDESEGKKDLAEETEVIADEPNKYSKDESGVGDEVIKEQIGESAIIESNEEPVNPALENSEFEANSLAGKTMDEKCGLDPEVAALLLEDDLESSDVARLKQPIMDDDLDLDIDSVLQGDLSPFVLKKRELKLSVAPDEVPNKVLNEEDLDGARDVELEKRDTSEETRDVSSTDDAKKDIISEEDVRKMVEDIETETGAELEEKPGESSTEGEKESETRDTAIGDQDFTNVAADVLVEVEDKPEERLGDLIPKDNAVEEPPKMECSEDAQRSEGDVMDLISDSGDDCNIVDSPEKSKITEDQMLDSDSVEDEEARKRKFEDEALEEDRLLQDDPMDSRKDEMDSMDLGDESNLTDTGPIITNNVTETDSKDEMIDEDLQSDRGVTTKEDELLKSDEGQFSQSVIKSLEDYKEPTDTADVDDIASGVGKLDTDRAMDLETVSDDDFDMDS